MPTVLRERGFRFFFWSNERNQPPHVHVDSGDGFAKFWLSPIYVAMSVGYDAGEMRDLFAIVTEHRDDLEKRGMTTSADSPGITPTLSARAVDVEFDRDVLGVRLEDGRRISVPIVWFPRLAKATDEQRTNWRLIGRGIGIHWPDIDEDISIENLLATR